MTREEGVRGLTSFLLLPTVRSASSSFSPLASHAMSSASRIRRRHPRPTSSEPDTALEEEVDSLDSSRGRRRNGRREHEMRSIRKGRREDDDDSSDEDGDGEEGGHVRLPFLVLSFPISTSFVDTFPFLPRSRCQTLLHLTDVCRQYSTSAR
jgi:hypothetical protein